MSNPTPSLSEWLKSHLFNGNSVDLDKDMAYLLRRVQELEPPTIPPHHIYHDNLGKVEYVQHMGSELTIVNAARVSFGKHKPPGTPLSERDLKLLGYLLTNKHTSTLEHNVITFRIKVPLFVRSQHFRHRTWSMNEVSRRYTDERLEFYYPDEFRRQHAKDRQASDEEQGGFDPFISLGGVLDEDFSSAWVRYSTDKCYALYRALLQAGVSREMARMVLPQNMYTQYYGTVNLNNLIKFLDLRLESHAQWEIRVMARACMEIAAQIWPVVIGPMLKERYKLDESV